MMTTAQTDARIQRTLMISVLHAMVTSSRGVALTLKVVNGDPGSPFSVAVTYCCWDVGPIRVGLPHFANYHQNIQFKHEPSLTNPGK